MSPKYTQYNIVTTNTSRIRVLQYYADVSHAPFVQHHYVYYAVFSGNISVRRHSTVVAATTIIIF